MGTRDEEAAVGDGRGAVGAGHGVAGDDGGHGPARPR